MEEITARLENWKVSYIYPAKDEVVLYGYIFEDISNRWVDGRLIRTSSFRLTESLKEGDTVHTRNSIYLLGKKNED